MRDLRVLPSLFGLTLLAAILMSSPAHADDDDIKPLAIGAPAPPFDLPGIDGKNHTLAEFSKAKVLAVIFTCNHCPTAQLYEDRIKKLVTDYGKRGVAVVAISPNDPEAVRPDELGYSDLGDSLDEMKVRARMGKFNFPYLLGGGPAHEKVSQAYGPTATPHAFVFDAARTLRYAGRIDDAERKQHTKVHDVRNALDALLAGKKVPVEVNKAFGCSTKWSAKRAEVKEYWDKQAKLPITVKKISADELRAFAPAGKAATRQDKGTGKFRLVNLWATWCGPCVIEFPEVIAMQRQYGDRDFEVITVAAEYPEDEKKVLAFLKKQKATTTNLMFGDTDKYKFIEAFDPKWEGSLPYTVLLDPKGKAVYSKKGAIDALALRGVIVSSLAKHKPW